MSDLRQRLGRVGVWCAGIAFAPVDEVRAGVRAIEELGFGSVWYPEGVPGRESFVAATIALEASDRLLVGTGIQNVYARDPGAAANGAKALADVYGGRFIHGLGVSHKPAVQQRGHDYLAPVPTMRAYLDAMESAPSAFPAPAEPAPVVLAALGPLMLRLAAERTAGAHPYFVPVAHTAYAREKLGPEPLLIPEVPVCIAGSREEAREQATGHLEYYLAAENYTNNLRRMGYEDADFVGPGSDRLFDALVGWGDVAAVAARVKEHLDAGADSVLIQTLPQGQFNLDQLRPLAPALLAL